MFTVLVRKNDGTENLYSADSVRKEPNALLMWGDSLHQGYGVIGPQGDEMSCDWDRVIYQDDDIASEGFGLCRIFVMNSVGRTVANYGFSDLSITKSSLPPDKTDVEKTLSESAAIARNSFKLTPSLVNDTKNQLIPKQDATGLALWYPFDKEISLLDLCYEHVGGYDARSRTPIISHQGGITKLLLGVSYPAYPDKRSLIEYSLTEPVKFVPQGSQMLTYDLDRNVVLNVPLFDDSIRNSFVNLSIHGKIVRPTGSMTITGIIVKEEENYNVEIIGYQADIYASYD